MLRIPFISLLAIFTGTLSFAQFSSPESVEFDPMNNRYIVSSTNNGNLLSLVPGQAPTLFTADVTSPYGLAEYNGVMYVCDDGFVKGYSLNTAQPVFSIDLSGTFLNGICSDGIGHLFVTDFSAKKIHRVNLADTTFSTVVANTGSTPNGILFDENHARLIFCTWGSSAKLVEVDTVSFALTPKITTTLSNFDGVVQDRCGNFLVSEWGSDKIYKIDSTFGTPVPVFSAGISNPADIYFNPLNDTLAVPNTSANTVTFYHADFCQEDTVDYTSLAETEEPLMFDVVSVPGEWRLLWKLPVASADRMQVEVWDMTGHLLHSTVITGSPLYENTHRIPTQQWATGIYLLRVSVGKQTASKKLYLGHP